MKDPSFSLINGFAAAGFIATGTVAFAYQSMIPETGAKLPYVVYEGGIAVRNGAKNQEGTEWVVTARVATPVQDHKLPGVIGDALTQALVPGSLDLSASGFKVVHCTLDSIIPTQVVKSGKDRWAETLYRYRYNLQEL